MVIWYGQPKLETVNAMGEASMVSHLGIEIDEIGEDYISATLPVDARTIQPHGFLHGGASVALAETLGSVAANLCVDAGRQRCMGLEINANHLRAVRQGRVRGTARPLHLGKSTQVWEIRIEDDEGRLICISRLTMAVLTSP